MSKTGKYNLQPYPRQGSGYLADDRLFPRADPISGEKLAFAVKSAFERALKTKKGEITSPNFPPARLIGICLKHLQERSDPILSPSFLSQCHLEEIFGMDAIAHEMQRHRMKIGNFYQFLVIELMRSGFDRVYDGKREGDVEAEINTPSYKPGLRLYISVKKSSDTVGGQDIGGVFNRLETLAKQDKNLTRPYMGVVAVATPQRGVISDYSASRFVRCKDDGSPYSANCEVWHPGFIFPFVCGRQAYDVYREALKQVGDFFPFNTLVHREKCSKMLAEELKKLGLVSLETGRIDPLRFQAFISRQSLSNAEKSNDDQ